MPASVIADLPGWRSGWLQRLNAGSALSARVQRLDDALHVQEAALGDPGHGRRLGRKVAGRQVDAGDLEERDPA